jgi:uncharacterized MAPEG superfamily protein
MLSHIQLWALFTVFATFKLLSNSVMQGLARYRNRSFNYPEDQLSTFGRKEPMKPETELAKRATALWRNDLENFVPFLMLSLAAAVTEAHYNTFSALLVVFGLARVGHARYMICPRQPHRVIAYAMGMLCILTMAALVVFRTFVP